MTVPAHGQTISIQGVTVAVVNDKFQVQKLETWFDPLDMFRQIAPKGIGNKEVVGTAEMKNSDSGHTRDGEALVNDLKMEAGSAIASAGDSENAKTAYAEMGTVRSADCPFLNAE